MSKQNYTKAHKDKLRDDAIERLREILKPGDTVYTVLRGRSASGMSRHIDVYKFKTQADGSLLKYWLSPLVANAAGFTFDRKKECLRVGGCGMDMGFHVVHLFSRMLFPAGFGERCRNCGKRPATLSDAADATAKIKRTSCAVKEPFVHEYYGRNGDMSGWDVDGGYALKQEWI